LHRIGLSGAFISLAFPSAIKASPCFLSILNPCNEEKLILFLLASQGSLGVWVWLIDSVRFPTIASWEKTIYSLFAMTKRKRKKKIF